MPLTNKMTGDLSNLKISSTADITTETVESTATINPLNIDSSPNIGEGIHPRIGEGTDHRSLDNLDYEHSGHRGFASSKDINTMVELTDSCGMLDQDTILVLKNNFTARMGWNSWVLTLTGRAGLRWTYASNADEEGASAICYVNIGNGDYECIEVNPAHDEVECHASDTLIHVQEGERESWNEKVSAEVDETTEVLRLIKEV